MALLISLTNQILSVGGSVERLHFSLVILTWLTFNTGVSFKNYTRLMLDS